MAALVNVAQNALVTGREAERWGNAHPNLVPYELFQTMDGPVVLAVGTDAQWGRCADLLGLDAHERRATWATNAGRVRDRGHLVAAIGERLATWRAAPLIEALAAAGVPCGVVRSVSDALREAGATGERGVPPATGGTVRLAPPALDAHGPQVREAGWAALPVTPGPTAATPHVTP